MFMPVLTTNIQCKQLTNSFGIMSGPEQKLRGPVPERHHHWVKVRQRFERRVEEPCKTHVGYSRQGGVTGSVSKQTQEHSQTLKHHCLKPQGGVLSEFHKKTSELSNISTQAKCLHLSSCLWIIFSECYPIKSSNNKLKIDCSIAAGASNSLLASWLI